MSLVDKIKSIVTDYLDEDLFLIDVLIRGKAVGQKVIILVDGDQGITIDQCASISRQMAATFDELDLIRNAYQLEVSSPGLDHPIKLKRQFIKNQGRKLKVATPDEELTGKLVQVGKNLTLEIKEKKESKMVEIPFDQVIKANVLVSFK